MTFSEAKALIRHARRVMQDLRAQVNARGLKQLPVAIHLPRADYEACQWGMGHLLKQWIPEIDAEGEIVPHTGKLTRIRGGYYRNDGTENFLFKGIPVRCREPYGLQDEAA